MTAEDPAKGSDVGGSRRSGVFRLAGFVLGVIFLIAAVWRAGAAGISWGDIASRLQSAPLLPVVLLLTLPLLNWLASAAMYTALMRVSAADRPMTFSDMTPLIGAGWLWNYLPLAPGLFGRIAYQKAVHGIPYRESGFAVIAAMAVSIIMIAVGLLAVVSMPIGRAGALHLAAIFAIALLTGAAWHAWAVSRGVAGWGRVVVPAATFRTIDLAVWSLRYWAAFRVAGTSLSPTECLALAVVSQIAALVPFVGNALGIREWAVGLAGAALPAVAASGPADGVGFAVSADLLNRAAEVLGAIGVGTICSGIIAGRLRRTGPSGGKTDA